MASITNARLRKLNFIMAGVHFAQGVLVLVLAKSFSITLTTSYLYYDKASKSLQAASHGVLGVSLPHLVADFFFVSALAHLLISTVYYKSYTKDLDKGINKARWFEYAISASIMIVAISLLVGIYDIAILAGAFALTAVMNLMGLVMEVHNQSAGQRNQKTNWLSFYIGSFAGIVPWLVIAFYFWASSHYGNAAPPTFVYYIFVSIFLFFDSFAVNMILQYKKVGKWRDYRFGELVYIWLSLVAKSALAWQVFAGTLRP